MGIEEFFDFMPEQVTTQAMTGRDASGAPIYTGGAITVYQHCRIELMNRRVIDSHGQEVMARGIVYLGSTVVPSISDKLTLPAEYVPQNPPIISINIEPDEVGDHHVELFIG